MALRAAPCGQACWIANHGPPAPRSPPSAADRRPYPPGRTPGLRSLRPCAAVAAALVARRAACAAGAAAEGDGTATAAPRRRRRRRKASPPGEGAAESATKLDLAESATKLELAERKEVLCDCDLIYETVVEMENVLTERECQCLIDAACDRAAKVGWGEVKHANYATQDVKVWNLGSREAVRIFKERLVEPMRVEIAENFGLPLPAVQVDDGFVVRYMEGAQRSLRYHRDGSIVSAIVSLSQSSDYEGGGTGFRDGSVYRPERGCGILFGGQRLHAGLEISGGSRYICTLFFKCGDFSCRDVAVARDTEVDGEKFWGEMTDFVGGIFGS